jgi:hypothetical protein
MRHRSREGFIYVACALLAFAWAWSISSDSLAVRLNWDSANYIGLYASGSANWSMLPWNSHFALGPIYWIGQALVAPFGGGVLDGVRILNALALAVAAMGFLFGARRLCEDAWFAAGFTALYALSWGVGILVLTFEDNVLYLPWVVWSLSWALSRIGQWRPRDSVVCGALVAGGSLVSWQAGLYLFAPLLVASFLGGSGRTVSRRMGDASLCGVASIVFVCAWVLFHAITSDGLTTRQLFSVLLSRPEPSFFPKDWNEVLRLIGSPNRIARHLGTGLMYEAGPIALESHAVRSILPQLGLVWFLLVAGAAVVASFWARIRDEASLRRIRVASIVIVLLALTAVTAVYVDLPSDKYKRYEYLPLLLSLLGAAVVGSGLGFLARTFWRRMAAFFLALAVVSQIALVLGHARRYRAEIETRQPPGYHSRDGVPWYVYFRRLRSATPDRCIYLFTQDELSHGRYQLEIAAGLWDALPDHCVIGEPGEGQDWRVKVKRMGIAEAKGLPACMWRSPAVAKIW